MVTTAERSKILKDLCITEAEIKRLKALGHEDATWRNQHELKVQSDWLERRHAFIQHEIDSLLPPAPRRKREPGEVPIVSHRTGRPNSGGMSQYGEQFG
jgi:hypothetical protein